MATYLETKSELDNLKAKLEESFTDNGEFILQDHVSQFPSAGSGTKGPCYSTLRCFKCHKFRYILTSFQLL